MYRGLTTKKENACEFNETWVEGDLIHSGDKVYIHPVSNRVSVKGELGSLIVMHEVQPDTVTQIMEKSQNKISPTSGGGMSLAIKSRCLKLKLNNDFIVTDPKKEIITEKYRRNKIDTNKKE